MGNNNNVEKNKQKDEAREYVSGVTGSGGPADTRGHTQQNMVTLFKFSENNRGPAPCFLE